jgi:beta-N-acetylhexosaminidase
MNPFSKSAWASADRILATLSLDQCLGQLLCPAITDWKTEELLALLREIELGSVFIGLGNADRWNELTTALNTNSTLPILVASDFEHGAGCMIPDAATDFPWAMAAGAAGSERLVRIMGEASRREGGALGAKWTLGPMIDLALNPNNPVVNTRSLGNSAEKVARLGRAWIEGIQANEGMAACIKHFPGDGVDDRDQHLCTSLNTLDVATWWRTYGHVWKETLKSKPMSVMIGHIGFPAFEQKSAEKALPATMSKKLMTHLLRGELGFEGVILSDAMIMGGITSRVSPDNIAVEFIRAGGDVVLFSNTRRDFAALKTAVAEKRISERSIRQKVRRVLAMKATLGLFDDKKEKPVSGTEKKRFQNAAQTMAEKSVTLVRGDFALPAKLPKGAKVLTITGGYGDQEQLSSKLKCIDEELRSRGYTVDRLNNTNSHKLRELAANYDRIFVNIDVVVHSLLGTVRITHPISQIFWESPWMDHPGKYVFTSFGSPWVAHEQPHLPNLLLCYGNCKFSQQAAVRAWLGEIPLSTGAKKFFKDLTQDNLALVPANLTMRHHRPTVTDGENEAASEYPRRNGHGWKPLPQPEIFQNNPI